MLYKRAVPMRSSLRRLSAFRSARGSGMGIPTVLHEQNAVLGRANRFLSNDAAAIATAYSEVERIQRRLQSKVVLVGNPVREAIAKLGETPFPAFDQYAPFKILVTGGSQGATVLSKVVPEGLGLLSPSLRLRLQVMQQCVPTTSTPFARAIRISAFRPS